MRQATAEKLIGKSVRITFDGTVGKLMGIHNGIAVLKVKRNNVSVDVKYIVEEKPLKASDYKAIRSWGKMMGSFEYYIRNEQERALKDKAPVDAIFRNSEGGWDTVEQIVNPEMKAFIKSQM